MNRIIAVLALSAALFAPASVITSPAFAEGTPFCHSKALNGETIDPPVCNDARANPGSTGNGGGQNLPACKDTGTVYGCYW